jgi:hypothetical protein
MTYRNKSCKTLIKSNDVKLNKIPRTPVGMFNLNYTHFYSAYRGSGLCHPWFYCIIPTYLQYLIIVI